MTARSISSLLVIGALMAAPAIAYEKGDVLVRAGATTVNPDESSGVVTLNGSSLGSDSGVGVDSDTQLGLTAAYMLDDHWGVELLAATPFEHTVTAKGAALAGLGVDDVADVKHLPPTLSIIYYFNSQGVFKPYVGAGLNYTVFFDESLSRDVKAVDAILSGGATSGGDIELEDSWGASFQLGADIEISSQWHVNMSVRWIDIDTDAKIKLDSGNVLETDVEIDPYVYTVALGYEF